MSYDFDRYALIHLRESKGLTREALAHALGVTPRRCQSWELANASPRPPDLAALARLFDVHPAQLCTIDPDHATLSHLRAWAGWTLRGLAAELGVAHSTVRNLETRGRIPSTWSDHDLARYAQLLDTTPETVTRLLHHRR